MDYKGLSPSELADSIGVQRSNVTHVLKSRNKPSFQFIEKMLQVYPEINAKWLLLGIGTMLENSPKNKTLFDQLTETPALDQQTSIEVTKRNERTEEPKVETSKVEVPKEVKTTAPVAEKKEQDNNVKDQFFSAEKPIERLIVFFKDQTFKVYYPSL